MAAVLSIGIPFAVQAGVYIKNGDVLSGNGMNYYLNSVGGTRAYIPIDLGGNGDRNPVSAFRAFTTDIGGKIESGSMANTAALRYTKLGASNSTMVKYGAVDGLRQFNNWILPPVDIGEEYNVVFRYAGLGITGWDSTMRNVSAEIITNPDFPSDAIQQSGTEAHDAILYKKVGKQYVQETKPVYGYGSTVYDLDDLFTNGMDGTSYSAKNGIVNSNRFTEMNTNHAEEAFTKWLNSGSEYAAKYKEKAETAINWNSSLRGLKWWQLLNRYMQINGDPTDDNQSVYFYVVAGKRTGHLVYRTYSIPGPAEANVSPTLLAVKDQNGTLVGGESYRNPGDMNKFEGCNPPQEYSGAISLEPGKLYTVEAMLSYFNLSGGSSNNTDRQIRFFATNKTSGSDPKTLSSLNATGSPNVGGISNVPAYDGKGSGSISCCSHAGDYSYGSAAFESTTFDPQELLNVGLSTGYLVVSVPTRYSEFSDNEFTVDDTLKLEFVIGAQPDPPVNPPQGNAYGDMNLGRREYRSYHFFETETEDDPDSPILDEEGNETGEYEQIEVIYEYSSPYGTYDDVSEGHAAAEGGNKEEVGDDSLPAEDERSIWHEGDGWWEYAENWPGEAEDHDYKLWLTDGSGTWDTDDHYTRGMTFGQGSYVTRSRGKLGTTVDTPTAEVKIYGVSPDVPDGNLIHSFTMTGDRSLPVYTESTALKSGLESYQEYPQHRVEVKVADAHGESGIFNSSAVRKAPFHNGWQTEHDQVIRTYQAECDDMRINEIEVKDSEGIVVMHASRNSSGDLVYDVEGPYDREEDLSLKVVVEQTYSANHLVHNPTIDIRITGQNEDGNEFTTYIDRIEEKGESYVMAGEGDTVVFDGIYFRPRGSQSITFNIDIDERHDEGQWNENEWDSADDSITRTLHSTTSDLTLRQNIELYNSKDNPQDYLTFAEYLDFKFYAEHHGSTIEQTAIVGGSEISPYVKLNARIYDADSLTQIPTTGALMYGNVVQDDPNAVKALLKDDPNVTAQTRLYPGLGQNGYASHVQLWMHDYVVQSHLVDSGNVAAYGHILVTGEIDPSFDGLGYNVRNNIEDYVQKEFYGEKNFKIAAVAANARNAIAKDAEISVEVAVENTATSYTDETVIDKTYLDIYVDGELFKTSEIEVPVGDTIVTEVIVDKPVFIDSVTDPGSGVEQEVVKDSVEVEARVNWGEHQTHYEYISKKTDTTLYPDPFVDNVLTTKVRPNLPDETKFPKVAIDDTLMSPGVFDDTSVDELGEDVADDSADGFKVVYHANNNSGLSETDVLPYQSSRNLRPANTFARTGYDYICWNTRADGSGTDYQAHQVVTVNQKNTYGDNPQMDLYAIWKPHEYVIRFNGTSASSGSMEDIQMKYDEAVYLPEVGFDKPGYVFMGWCRDEECLGDVIDNGSRVINLTAANGETVILYAKWLAIADCVVLEDYDETSAGALRPKQVFRENPSVKSFADYQTYAFLRVKIPTVKARKLGDKVAKVYDLLEPNWDYDHWTKVSSFVSEEAGVPSEYIFVYNYTLGREGTSAVNPVDSSRLNDRTSDLFTQYSVGDFVAGVYTGSAELQGAIIEADEISPDPVSAAPAAEALFRSDD